MASESLDNRGYMSAAVIGSFGLPPGFAVVSLGGAEYPKFFLTAPGQPSKTSPIRTGL